MKDTALVVTENAENEIRDFILREFDPEQSTLGIDDELLDRGIVDSLGLIQLLTFIETKFGVKVDAEELTPTNFKTINCIARLIEGKKKAGLIIR